MKLLEFAFDASKRIVKTAAALLQVVLNAVMALVQTLCRFLGITPPPSMPQPFVPSTTAQDVRDEYANSFTTAVECDQALASDLGQAVYQFAQALDPAIRGAVDLGGLSPSQIDWLLGLSEADLQRLAQAGPRACELAVCGRKCGVVGLPIPPSVSQEIEGPSPVRDFLVDKSEPRIARSWSHRAAQASSRIARSRSRMRATAAFIDWRFRRAR